MKNEQYEQHGQSLEPDVSLKMVLRGLYGLCRELGRGRSSQPADTTEQGTVPPVCGLVFRAEEGPQREYPEQGQLF